MRDTTGPSRRGFLLLAGAFGSSVIVGNRAWAQAKPESQEAEVSPTEDLMREHGVLRRILLIYDHVRPTLGGKNPPDMKVIAAAAGVIRQFIEDYHERLEEDFLFPRFEKQRKLVDLVAMLRRQHQIGRGYTAEIEQEAKGGTASDPRRMAKAMANFQRLYRPHASREDTVLFPGVHQLVSGKEFDELGDQFEDKETQLFGKNGFESMVERVAGLEKQLGIYDLAQFSKPAAP